MVRKKTSKKRVNKKEKSSASISKKDFEAFKFGVSRLKELENELKSIDTRGFSKETIEIRSKLKNVSEIPNIERLLKSLKLKISHKYKPKKRRATPAKEIKEGLEDVQEEITKLRRSKREDMESLKKEIVNLKHSKTRDFGSIKDEITKLRKSKKAPYMGSLDSGVDVLVDTNFNEFLASTKKALSERIKNREQEMDGVLRKDLENRELKYKKKHKDLLNFFENHKKKLEQDYSKKYNRKVESTLHKEVSEKFSKMLRDKLDKEKIELGKFYKAQLREHAQGELERQKLKLKKAMEKELSSKENVLEERIRKRILEYDKKEGNLSRNIERNKIELKKARDELALEEKEGRKEIQDSKRELLNKKEEERKRLEKAKGEFDILKKKKLQEEREELQKLKKDLLIKETEEKKALRKRLFSEMQRNLEKELSKKEVILKRQLHSEYELKLKKQIQEHEQELKKRKIDLELEMSRKIKQLLN